MSTNTISVSYWKSPVGELIIGSLNGEICLADWRYRKMRDSIDSRIQKFFNAEYSEEESETNSECISQLKEYFTGNRKEFTLPMVFAGSNFQISVWNALLRIPYGKTESYLGLSKRLGNEKAIRAVASANGANAISIIVPCHRIIGSNGDLTGYAGGVPAKKKLLDLEGALVSNQMELF